MEVDESYRHKLASCPESARSRIDELIDLVKSAANEESVDDLACTLKWGELAFVAKSASTIRIAWSDKNPDKCSLYFNCNSKLVDTFRSVYPELHYVGNREIVLDPDQSLPRASLRHCFSLALTYQLRKKLPLLGA